MKTDTGERAPWFCSGCPHNTSTRVPEGSRAVAGIGCHFMAIWMDRSTATFTQMGGEGVPWVGQAPFTKRQAHLRQPRRRHLLPQRLAGHPPEHRRGREHHLQGAVQRRGGDDRRAAGGRAAEGHSVLQIAEEPGQRRREEAGHRHRPAGKVRRRRAGGRGRRCTTATSSTASSASCASCRAPRPSSTTRPAPPRSAAAASAASWPRRTSAWSSTSWCARAAATVRVQSNCLSVEPVETEFGRKRRINQSTCNLDYQLRQGLLPELRHGRGRAVEEAEEGTTRRPVGAAALARARLAAGPE